MQILNHPGANNYNIIHQDAYHNIIHQSADSHDIIHLT